MPSPGENSTRQNKRKRVSANKTPSKRSRTESSNEDAQAQILLLEHEVFASKKNYNNIAKLIRALRADVTKSGGSLAAAVSLCRIFMSFMVAGELEKGWESTDKDLVVIKWLRERYNQYKSVLTGLLRVGGIANTALELCMRLLKTEGKHLLNGQDYSFPTTFLKEIIQGLLNSETEESVRKDFSEKYVEENDDIRFYTFECIELVS